ncbi:hypothetical protein [Fischerella thermalis]|uniref:hypothetical protein n=1 Tax=Fischerella thermalis TaxID=372787 RepID=UPI0015E0A17A|nr:hypothetical protein [Fischerella thermalis]
MRFSWCVRRIDEHGENQCGLSRFERLGDGLRGDRKPLRIELYQVRLITYDIILM